MSSACSSQKAGSTGSDATTAAPDKSTAPGKSVAPDQVDGKRIPLRAKSGADVYKPARVNE
jgi:hypothetical protein